MSKLNWNVEGVTESLKAKATALGVAVISQEQVAAIAAELATETGKDVTARSVGSKLRKEGFEVQKANEVQKSPWTPEQEAEEYEDQLREMEEMEKAEAEEQIEVGTEEVPTVEIK